MGGVGCWARKGREWEGGARGALKEATAEGRETRLGKEAPRCAFGTGTGGVRLEVGVQARCCLNGVFVWSGSGRRPRWGRQRPTWRRRCRRVGVLEAPALSMTEGWALRSEGRKAKGGSAPRPGRPLFCGGSAGAASRSHGEQGGRRGDESAGLPAPTPPGSNISQKGTRLLIGPFQAEI